MLELCPQLLDGLVPRATDAALVLLGLLTSGAIGLEALNVELFLLQLRYDCALTKFERLEEMALQPFYQCIVDTVQLGYCLLRLAFASLLLLLYAVAHQQNR